MKKHFYLIALGILTVSVTINAQTKIKDGTVAGSALPNANAILELESSNKGLLLPRVTLSSTTAVAPLAAHIAGMTVYNTATTNDVTPGYYYNDGAKWVKLSAGAGPWNVQNTTAAATINTQHIYQTGSVAIGKDTAVTGTLLDVSGAIRAGIPHSEEVNGSSVVGINSVAFGTENRVSGRDAFAAGYSNTVTGDYGIALGDGHTITGDFAVGLGGENTVSGNEAFSVGHRNVVSGEVAIAMGSVNTVNGLHAMALGSNNTVSGEVAAGIGSNNNVSGQNAFAAGAANRVSGTNGMALGYNNTVSGPDFSIALGYMNTVNANAAAIGESNQINAPYSMGIGQGNYTAVNANYAIGIGQGNQLQGEFNFGLGRGNNNTGNYAATIGSDNTASGNYSMAIGHNNTVASNVELVLGRYNAITTGTADSWVDTDPLFQIGNGTDDGNRTNAVTVLKNGNTGIRNATPNSALTVNGSANNLSSYNAAAGTTIDFSKSNLAYSTANRANTFDLTNVKDGGTYTLALKGSDAGTAAFTATGFTVHLPVDHGASVAGKHSVYTIIVMGSDIYMSWIAGY